jgi:hypothetical protein
LMLLAIADFADEEGTAWGTVRTLAEKSRLTERHVPRILADLEASGELQILRGAGRLVKPTRGRAAYKSDLYVVVAATRTKCPTSARTPDIRSREPRTSTAGGSEIRSTYKSRNGNKTLNGKRSEQDQSQIHRRPERAGPSADTDSRKSIKLLAALATAQLIQPLIFAGHSVPALGGLSSAIHDEATARGIPVTETTALAAAALVLRQWGLDEFGNKPKAHHAH